MNNDLISREALKKALHNFFDGKVIDEPAYILRDVFCQIDGAPTVKCGGILDETDEDYILPQIPQLSRCPDCGYLLEKYCPNCSKGRDKDPYTR